MPIEIPEHVLKNAPWSYSKAGVIQKCSLQYDYKYGSQKRPEKPREDSAESRIGKVVHRALEFALDAAVVPIPVNKAFQFAIDQGELTTDEVEKVMSHFSQVENFVQKMMRLREKRGVKMQHVLIERKAAISRDYKSTTFFDNTGLLRGQIDYALVTNLGDGIVIDHKSGKQREMSEYEDQCRVYCILMLALYPGLKGVQTAINFTQTDQLLWNPRVTAETIQNEYYPWLVKYLENACTGLLTPPKAQDGWWCGWCGYKDLCPKFADKK